MQNGKSTVRGDVPSCRLDENGFVSLSSILEAFNEALNEEQAWALCYQTSKFLQDRREEHHRLDSAADLLIHKEGPVSVASACLPGRFFAFLSRCVFFP